MKLKELLKEAQVWERKFGEPLPTFSSVMEKHSGKKDEPTEPYDLSDFDTAAAKFQELTGINPIQKKVTANKGMYNTSEIANNLGNTTIRLIEDIYSKDFEKIGYSMGDLG